MDKTPDKKLRDAVIDTVVGIYTAGTDFRISFTNRLFNEIYGYEETEAYGRNLFDVIFSSIDEACVIKEYLTENSRWKGRALSAGKNGEEFPVSVSICKIFDGEGRLTAYAGKIEDISEISKKEEETSRSKRFLKFALDSLQTQVIILDENGVIIHFNEAFRKFGREHRDMTSCWTGLNYLDIMDAEASDGSSSAAKAAAGIREIISGARDSFSLEYLFESAGDDIWFLMTASRFRENVPPRFVVSFENITQRKNAESELIRARLEAESASKAKSRFLAGMSHEIRTPMNAILGYAQHLLREKTLEKKLRGYVEIISRSGQHLLELINEILDMSKIEAGKMVLTLEDTDFFALIGDIEILFRGRAEERGIYLEISIDETVPQYIYADGKKIRQVIINMIGNAIKFTTSGGIRVRAVKLNDDPDSSKSVICVEVEDTGCGIAAEELDRVFEIFEQASSGIHQGGTGLGMPISLEYAKLMGGDLSVKSEPGQGSVFTFTFKAELLSSLIKKTRRPETRRVTGIICKGPSPGILIVDDVASNRSVLRLLLESAGFRVNEAANGQEALSVIAEWMPDAIFMDRYMPSLDGIEASKIIKSSNKCRNIPILMLSASAIEENRDNAIRAGINVFLRKPFIEEEVFENLKKLLGVEYVYEENINGASSGRTEDIIASAAASLSPETRNEIIEAAELCDVTRLRKILNGERLSSHPELVSIIESFLNNYEYAKIVALIKA